MIAGNIYEKNDNKSKNCTNVLKSYSEIEYSTMQKKLQKPAYSE